MNAELLRHGVLILRRDTRKEGKAIIICYCTLFVSIQTDIHILILNACLYSNLDIDYTTQF